MTVDLKDLKELAKAATGGSWAVLTKGGTPTDIVQIDAVTEEAISCACTGRPKQNAAFIAAANPKTVLELIARVEAAEGALEHSKSATQHWCEVALEGSADDALRSALEQAKAREAELLSALEPFAKVKLPVGRIAVLPDDTEVRLSFFKAGFVRSKRFTKDFTIGDLRLAVTAMGGDDA